MNRFRKKKFSSETYLLTVKSLILQVPLLLSNFSSPQFICTINEEGVVDQGEHLLFAIYPPHIHISFVNLEIFLLIIFLRVKLILSALIHVFQLLFSVSSTCFNVNKNNSRFNRCFAHLLSYLFLKIWRRLWIVMYFFKH